MNALMILVAMLFGVSWPAAVAAQVVPVQPDREIQPPLPPPPPAQGRVAESTVGEVGQRQSREDAVEGIRPATRLANRIQNRVQLRLRNRIDRNYDAAANATDPFAIAQEQTRTAGRSPR